VPTVWAKKLRRKRRRKPRPEWLRAAHIQPTEEEEARYRPIDWPLIKRLFSQLAPYKRRYALGIFLGLIMVTLEMQAPRFIGWIINVATGYAAGALSRAAAAPNAAVSTLLGPAVTEGDAIRRIVGIILLWAATMATALLLHRKTILIMVDAGERVQFDLRRRIFHQLQRLSMSYYDRTKLGRIISRCTSDVSSLRDVNVWGIDTVVKNVLMMAVAAAMLLKTEPRLFLAVGWLGPVLFACNRMYRRRAGRAYQTVREGYTRVSSNLAENITGVRVVTAFDRQVQNLGVFNILQDRNTANNVAAARVNGLYQPLLQLIGFTGKGIILLYGGFLVASGRLPGVGSVVTAFLYWDWFMAPMVNFGNFYNQLMMAMAGAERLFNLLDMKPEVHDLAEAQPLPSIQGHVTFEHVTFGYRPETPVLHDICFEAHPGQMVALVGPTGGGKSTVISLIARFYQPQHGRVLVDDQDIRYVAGDSLHRQMGLVLQVNFLFTGTVMENIRYARPEATDDEVIAAARAIGCYETITSLQNGFQTEVGERGANMSLGQRQLICFARAFLADPRIFMLDEATSSIDTATEQAVQRCLERLLEGRTTFIVAHRLSTILRADRILVIDGGRITERGTHSELLRLGGRYAGLYEQFAASEA
jgi:ATP-binding cassette, subfamily B, bacterial